MKSYRTTHSQSRSAGGWCGMPVRDHVLIAELARQRTRGLNMLVSYTKAGGIWGAHMQSKWRYNNNVTKLIFHG